MLTTIGPEHLERFKTMERIVQTKEELIEALPADGIAVVNQDDPLVRAIGDRAAARGLQVIRYGQAEPAPRSAPATSGRRATACASSSRRTATARPPSRSGCSGGTTS